MMNDQKIEDSRNYAELEDLESWLASSKLDESDSKFEHGFFLCFSIAFDYHLEWLMRVEFAICWIPPAKQHYSSSHPQSMIPLFNVVQVTQIQSIHFPTLQSHKDPSNLDLSLLTSNTSDGFLSRQISDMDEGVVERGKDVCDTEDQFTFTDLWT